MNRLTKQGCIAAALALLAAPLATTAQERQVAPPERKPPERALLLPAVQKAQEQGQEQAPPEGEGVMPHYNDGLPGANAQQGIEPDEIDARNRASAPAAPRGRIDKATPGRAPAAGSSGLSTQQMMAKLEADARKASTHRRILPITAKQQDGGGTGPTSVQAKPPEPPKYEIADCGTATNPAICCHHEAGDGSSCNLFIMLCEHHGGTGKGDGESAMCTDW